MPLPDWSSWILVPLFVLLITLFSWAVRVSERRDREHVRRVFSSRAAVSPLEFAAACRESPPTEVVDRVRSIIATISDSSREPDSTPTVPPDHIAAHDVLGSDLGYCLDSLAFFELVASVEKEFGVRIRDRELAGLITAADVASLIWRKVRASAII
jgi:acyl carrier protein